LKTVAGNLVCFLCLWPEPALGEHFSGFECFLRFLFADFAEGFVEAFGEERFALFGLFDEISGLLDDLAESILLLLERLCDGIAVAFGAERGGLGWGTGRGFTGNFPGEFLLFFVEFACLLSEIPGSFIEA
jgi:hypothetical protein